MSDAPWWAEGLRFHCTACGECCTGAPGYVWITKEDVERMARATGLDARAFKRRYVRRAKGKLSLKERENGDCTLLDGGRCTVYEAKPVRCSTFPFWPEILGHESEWRETRGRCEGIDQGPLYDREEIERLLLGDSRPLERHQAEAGKGASEGSDPDPPWDAAFADLEALYAELERELPRYRFTCAASGKCCDFDAYGHRLYATTIEAEYFFRKGPQRPLNDDERLCPAYGEEDRLCHARDGRMLGCRAYFCGPYPVIPPDDVYERYHARIKRLHERHGIPFSYRDLLDWRGRRATSLRAEPSGSCSGGASRSSSGPPRRAPE